MGSRLAWSPFPPLVVALGLLWLAPICMAAGPVNGGRYASLANVGIGVRVVGFNVDDRGRSFVSNPRLVFQGSEIEVPCQGRPWDLGGFERINASGDVMTVSDGTPVRIARDGSFSLSATVSGAGLNLRGRFVRGGRLATGSVRVSAPGCATRTTFAATFTGQRHLTHGSCSPAGTQTLAGDGIRRVYRQRYVYDPVVRAGGYGNGYAIYGCDRRTQRHWFLAGDDRSSGLADAYSCSEHFGFDGSPVLVGHLAALVLRDVCQAGGVQVIRIVDLDTGAVVLDAVPPIAPGDSNVQISQLQSLVVAPTGSAAWIVKRFQTQLCQVIAEIPHGPKTLLDQGDQIDPNSLRLDGSTVSWSNNGETKTATLG
jgi:hypothetical protein